MVFLKEIQVSPESLRGTIAGGIVGFTARLNPNQLKKVMSHPYVKYIEMDRKLRIISAPKPVEFDRQKTELSGISYSSAIAFPSDVVNMSLSGGGFQWVVDLYIKLLLGNRGIFVTIAAGNNNANPDGFWTASTNGSNIYTISNMAQAEEIAASSNFGNEPVDYAAPSTSIYSTGITRNGSYSTRSGTSMAAPHVAGILLVNSDRINTNGKLKVDKDPIPDDIAVK